MVDLVGMDGETHTGEWRLESAGFAWGADRQGDGSSEDEVVHCSGCGLERPLFFGTRLRPIGLHVIGAWLALLCSVVGWAVWARWNSCSLPVDLAVALAVTVLACVLAACQFWRG